MVSLDSCRYNKSSNSSINNNTTKINNMKILQIITMAAYASVPLMTSAAQEPMKCSCTPNSYSFKLNFHGTCSSNSNPIMNKNNPGGITGSMCYFVRDGGNPNDILSYMDSLGGGAGADGAFPSHTFDDKIIIIKDWAAQQ